jgi:hypothetical protein
MVSGIIGNSIYAQTGNDMYQFPITWTNQQTVATRGRRSSEASFTDTAHVPKVQVGAGVASGFTTAGVAWAAGGAAVVVMTVVAVMIAMSKLVRHAKIKRRVTDVDLFVNIGGGYFVPKPTRALNLAITNVIASATSTAGVARRSSLEVENVGETAEVKEPRPVIVRHM